MHQHLSDLLLSVGGSEMKCRPSLRVLPIDIGTLLQQQLYQFRVPLEGRAHKSRIVHGYRCVRVGPTFDQGTCNTVLSEVNGKNQRSKTLLVRRMYKFRPLLDQLVNPIDLPGSYCVKKVGVEFDSIHVLEAFDQAE